jgi:large subunit ribosomal protein L22e
MVKTVQKGGKSKKPTHKYTIKCTDPIEDNVLVLNDFESYLVQRIKVDGKTGNLGNSVTVAKDKDTLIIETKIAFSKRYLKYLTKKYLKQQELREYLRVVATAKNVYELKFFTVNNDEADQE